TLLLALGPVFIVFGLFSQTRGLFSGWLRAALGFAFVPMLVTLGGSAVLALLTPVLMAIVADPAAAARNSQPVLILFMGALIYAALILMLMAVAFMLVRHWDPVSLMASDPQLDKQPDYPGTGQSQTLFGTNGYSTTLSVGGSAPTVQGLERQSLIQRTYATLAPNSLTGYAQDRATPRPGLGQRFRKPAPSASPPSPVSKAPG
ncbi:MAG: type IV secretion system protein, partial [Asticcacaulis sp.]